MPEVVNIEVLIEASKSAKTLDELNNSIEDLNSELSKVDKNSKDFKKLTSAIDEASDKALELAINSDKANLTLGELEQTAELLGEKLKGVERGTEEFNKLSGALIETNRELKNTELSLEALDNEQVASELGSVAGAVGDVTSAFILLGGEGNETLEEIGQNIETAIGISIGLKGAIEGISSGVKLFKNFGNVLKQNNAFLKTASILQGAFNTVTALFSTALGSGTKALKIFKIALISTGIGAIIVGIGTAIGLIITNFESLKKVFTGGGGAIGKALRLAFFPITLAVKTVTTLIEAVKFLYGVISAGGVEAFEQLQKEREEREKLIKANEEAIAKEKEKTEALEDQIAVNEKLRDSESKRFDTAIFSLGEEIRLQKALNGENSKTEALALDLAKIQQESTEAELNSTKQILADKRELLGSLETQIELNRENLRLSIDNGASIKEQNKFADEVTRLEAERSKTVKEVNEEFERGNKLAREEFTLRNNIEIKEAEISKKRAERSKKREEERKKEEKAEEERLNKVAEIEESLFQASLDNAEDLEARKLTLQFEAQRKRITELVKDEEKLKTLLKLNEEQFFKDLEKIEEKFSKADDKKRQELINKEEQTALAIEQIDLELQLAKLDNSEASAEARKKIEEDLLNVRIKQIEKERDIALQNKELTEAERVKISKEADKQILEARKTALDKETEANKEATEKQKEDREALKEALVSLGFETAQLISDTLFEIAEQEAEREKETRLNKLEETFNAENDLLNKRVEEGLITQREADRQLAELERKKIANIQAEEKRAFEEAKRRQKAQAIINGALAFTNALATTQPLVPLGLVAGAGVLISTGVQIAKIESTKYARGGILKGNSHAKGGIKTSYGELEGGEAVINKRSTSMFRSTLSRINEAGGGVKFASGGILGTSPAGASEGTSSDLTNVLTQLNSNLSKPIRSYVVETEITNAQNKARGLENNASL